MRRQLYKITDESVARMLQTRGPETISVDGVPDDASFVALHYDPTKRMIYVIFEHESFEDLPDLRA